MFDGKQVSEEEAVRIMRSNNFVDPETGRKSVFYPDQKSAIAAAQRRTSGELGQYGGGMSNLDRALEALRAADKAGNTEDAKKLAGVVRRLQGGEQPQAEPAQREDLLGALNWGISRVLGAPVDVANAALSLVGLGSREPVGGAESIERGMGAVGVRTKEPAGAGELIAAGTGSAVAGLPAAPVMAGVRGAGALARTARHIGETFARRPIGTATFEVAAGAGSGGGQAIAREMFPENETAEMLGAMAGGFGLPALPALAFRLSGARLATKITTSQAGGFTRKGREAQASARLQSLAGSDIEGAIASLNAPGIVPGARITAAQKTGNRRIMALEREIGKTNQDLGDLQQRRFEQSNNVVRQEIQGLSEGGSVEATRNWIGARRDYLLGLMGERVKRAQALAAQTLARIGPQVDRATANAVVRREIEGAMNASIATERQIWDALPLELQAPAVSTRKALLASVSEMVKGDTLADLPDALRRHLTPTKGGRLRIGVSPSEQALTLHQWRSRALEQMRVAKAEGRRNDARHLDRFQEAILDDLGALEGQVSGDLGQQYRTALDFSRQLNEKFRRGTVGGLLGFKKTGGAAVDPSLTLERSLVRDKTEAGAAQAAVAVDDILRAVDGAPDAARGGMADFVKTMFAEQATNAAGGFNPTAAGRFLGRNQALLDRFPGLQTQFEEAVRTGRLSDDLQVRVGKLTKSLADKSKSRAALFADAHIEQEITSVLRDPDPGRAAKDLLRMTNKDRTGEATKGLRTALSEFLLAQGGKRSQVSGDVQQISGKDMRQAIFSDTESARRIRAVMDNIYGPAEKDSLKRIMTTLERLETARGPLPGVGGILQMADAPILEFMITTMGARGGAQLGAGTSGASLKTASMGAERMKQIFATFLDRVARKGTRGLLEEAINNRNLMRSLLMRTDTPTAKRFVSRHLHAWLIGLGDERVNEILKEEPSKEPSHKTSGLRRELDPQTPFLNTAVEG